MTNMKKRNTAVLTATILAAALTIPATAIAAPAESIRVSSYKGSTLEVGERSGLIIGPSDTEYDGITYCYIFVGIPNSVNFYA